MDLKRLKERLASTPTAGIFGEEALELIELAADADSVLQRKLAETNFDLEVAEREIERLRAALSAYGNPVPPGPEIPGEEIGSLANTNVPYVSTTYVPPTTTAPPVTSQRVNPSAKLAALDAAIRERQTTDGTQHIPEAQLRNALPELAALVAAVEDYSPRYDHDWRCEVRTGEAGWHEGEPPVIDCCCGRVELDASLAALDERLS